jgi:hypothetical protein
MKLIGQRWRYRVGNSRVDVDNAFSWSLWGQERMLVNGETMHRSGGHLRLFQSYKEPWLSALGEGELRVSLKAVLQGIACVATLDGETIEPEALFECRWKGGAHDWPAEEEWQPTVRGAWIKG